MMYGTCPTFLHQELAIPKSGYPLLASSPPLLQGEHRCSAGLISGCGWPALPCLWCRWRDILSQTPHSHTRAVLSAEQHQSPASFPVSVIYTLEADFRGTLEFSCFAGPWKYLKGVQEEFIDKKCGISLK